MTERDRSRDTKLGIEGQRLLVRLIGAKNGGHYESDIIASFGVFQVTMNSRSKNGASRRSDTATMERDAERLALPGWWIHLDEPRARGALSPQQVCIMAGVDPTLWDEQWAALKNGVAEQMALEMP